MPVKKIVVTIFGSSKPKDGDPEYQTAYAVGKALAEEGYVVCNGGYGGTMEASARGATEAGGTTIGITCKFFGRQANSFIDKTLSTMTLNDRLMKLIEFGDAYIVLQGGTGTLVELATVWEYMNKRVMIPKPIIIMGSFWSPVITTLRNELIWEGMGSATQYISEAVSPQECLEILRKKLGIVKKS